MNLISSLSFIGGGKVARHIIKSFLSAGIIKANAIVAVTGDNKLVLEKCKFVFLATQARQVSSLTFSRTFLLQ